MAKRDWHEYPFRRKNGSKIPFGYKVCPADPNFFEPIPEQLRALEEAFDYLDQGYHTDTSITAFLVAKTKRTISRQGLLKLWAQRRGIDLKNRKNGKPQEPVKAKTRYRTYKRRIKGRARNVEDGGKTDGQIQSAQAQRRHRKARSAEEGRSGG